MAPRKKFIRVNDRPTYPVCSLIPHGRWYPTRLRRTSEGQPKKRKKQHSNADDMRVRHASSLHERAFVYNASK